MEQRYKEMFDEVHAPQRLKREVMEMTRQREGRTTGRRLSKSLMIAAVLVVALMGTAVAAEKILGVHITEMFSTDSMSEYEVMSEPMYYPMENFSSPKLKDALESIQQQYQEAQTWDDLETGWYKVYLRDWQECEEFLGVELPNPLENLEGLTHLASNALEAKADEQHCDIRLYADSDGRLEYVNIDTCYQAETCKISLDLHFAAEGGPYEAGVRAIYEGGMVDYSTDDYELSDGQKAVLVTARYPDDKYSETDAYFVRDDAVYDLRVWRWAPEEESNVRETEVKETIEFLLEKF